MADTDQILPPSSIAFVGIGKMGLPMAMRLIAAGYDVRAADPSEAARSEFTKAGGRAFATNGEACAGASIVITMLPNGSVVRDVLLGKDGIAGAMLVNAVVVDMSSCSPTETAGLAADLSSSGIAMVDAPVSGGVKRAIDGSLAIMVGGAPKVVDRVRPVLAAMGKLIVETGSVGSGHAMKALNNYVSAAGLIAACEAVLVGKAFGLRPETIIDVLNSSSGRNNSTELKMKQFVLNEGYDSGFALALMAKDLKIAADLATCLKLSVPQVSSVAGLWDDALDALAVSADHTEIYRYLEARAGL